MRRTFLTVASMCVMAGPAFAQGAARTDTIPPAAGADSQAILKALDARVRANPKDAAAWNRIGMINWVLSDRSRATSGYRDPETVRLTHVADSTLKIAADAAPANAYYRLLVAKFLQSSQNPGAQKHFDIALDVARKGIDSVSWAEAAVSVGNVFWRRFDNVKNRRMNLTTDDVGRSISDAMQPVARNLGALAAAAEIDPFGDVPDWFQAMYGATPQLAWKDVGALIQRITMPLPADLNGASDYERASALFREAYAASPANARAFRSVAMALADSSRWHELDAFTRAHLARIPWDPNAWMALGLARQREGDGRGAAAAFDSAMANFTPAERARLDRIQRVLRPNDTARVTRANKDVQAATSSVYWRFADPLWSRPGNESRTEFLARVEFAELRWTVDELGVRGAETDRGDIYIRYGPPDIVAAIQPKASSDGNDIITFWLYKSGLMFSFSGMSMYGTARTPIYDRGMTDAIKEAQPVRWDNIGDLQVDTMPLQVARFRGGRDSVDVIVATKPPFAAITAASDVKEPMRSSFWLVRNGTVTVYDDSSTIDAPGPQSWTHRVAPGAYAYRAEASASGSLRAGRISAEIVADADSKSGFALSGFGISDVLIATRADAAATGARWSGLHAEPLAGAIARNGQLNLVWENYDFTAKDGVVQYTVAISIAREHTAAGRITARILGALAEIAQINLQGDRIVLTFDRSVPQSAAFADDVQIALGETPAGVYTVSLEVTDKVSGKKAARATRLVVRQ